MPSEAFGTQRNQLSLKHSPATQSHWTLIRWRREGRGTHNNSGAVPVEGTFVPWHLRGSQLCDQCVLGIVRKGQDGIASCAQTMRKCKHGLAKTRYGTFIIRTKWLSTRASQDTISHFSMQRQPCPKQLHLRIRSWHQRLGKWKASHYYTTLQTALSCP